MEEMNSVLCLAGRLVAKAVTRFLVLAVAFLLLPQTSQAFSFMYVKEKSPLPYLRFQEFVSGDMHDFGGNQKGPLVLIFWGADIDTKRERAVKVLNDIQKGRSFYRERGVDLAAVFVQPDHIVRMDEIIDRAQVDFPIYVDIEKQSFEKLGVYVMPSILIVSADGIIHKGLGYTPHLDKILFGEIKILLQEKTREEVNAQLNPQIVEKTAAQRRARMDYNYALNLIRRQRIEMAIGKLDMALEKDPDFVPALVEKGCLLINEGKFQEAEELLARGLNLEPGFSRALTCKVALEAAKK